MGKAKRRSLKNGINDKFPYMTRESALCSIINNIENKQKVIVLLHCLDFPQKKCLKQEPNMKMLWHWADL